VKTERNYIVVTQFCADPYHQSSTTICTMQMIEWHTTMQHHLANICTWCQSDML